jgi:N12 class adenine-specific DNA methylase
MGCVMRRLNIVGHTLDKLDSSLRELLGARTEFLGAIRLPNNAFKKNAGTEVTTDIVMLRRLLPGETPRGPAWKSSVEFTNDRKEKFYINEYFAVRPEMMLGTMRLARGMYRQGEPMLVPDERDLVAALAQAVGRLPQNIYQAQAARVSENKFDPAIPAPDYVKPNAFCLHEDGRLCLNEDGVLRPLDDLPVETRSRIRRMIELRDAVRKCMRSQLDGSPEEQVVEAREDLNLAYDRLLGRFGPINSIANQRAFHGDPDLPLLQSLENYDEETKKAAKAAIFRERTIHHKQPVQSAGSPKEALLVSLNEKGRVDLAHMGKLLARPEADFLPDLRGMVFLNPQTKQWETEDQYLSGNVREKLVAADAASVAEPRFRENVEALKSVQPEDLPATEIDLRLGASWLPPEDVQAFVHSLLGIESGVQVGHTHIIFACDDAAPQIRKIEGR